MAITIKDITELPTGTPIGSSPVIFGVGTNLFRTTLATILSQVDQGITDISYRTLDDERIVYIIGDPNPLTSVNVTIAEGELVDILIEVIDGEVVTLNRYRIPLGEGVYEPLSDTIGFDDLILIERKPLGVNPDGSNTVTYVAADLAAINASSPALDLTDSSLIYFIDLDAGFYRFVGTNGLYGSGQLQMVEGDLVEIQQAVTNPQPEIGTPPASGTFSVDLSNFFGTDYSGTLTSLTSINIGSGKALGGFARVKGNWSTEPTVTGATQANNSGFEANTDLYMYFEAWDDGVIYWYDLD